MATSDTNRGTRSLKPDADIMWTFVYWPMIWVGIVHVGTRIMWLLGYG